MKAFGDLDEDDRDTNFHAQIELIKELDFPTLLLRGAAYMAIHPDPHGAAWFVKKTGVGNNGFVIVRGKQPKAKGGRKMIFLFLSRKRRQQ